MIFFIQKNSSILGLKFSPHVGLHNFCFIYDLGNNSGQPLPLRGGKKIDFGRLNAINREPSPITSMEMVNYNFDEAAGGRENFFYQWGSNSFK